MTLSKITVGYSASLHVQKRHFLINFSRTVPSPSACRPTGCHHFEPVLDSSLPVRCHILGKLLMCCF